MNHHTLLAPIALLALALAAPTGHAATCTLAVEANDMMQFNTARLELGADCGEVELTLRNVGKQPASVMGHNWVLVRSSDLGSVASAGLRAGRAQNFLPPGDPRVVAATPLIGGGESITVRFPATALKGGASYSFFCSTPGHNATMRGRLVTGVAADRLTAQGQK